MRDPVRMTALLYITQRDGALSIPAEPTVLRKITSELSVQFHVPSLSGKAGKVFTWNGWKGLPSKGISSLSSELTLTSTWDSEMEAVN